MRGLSPAAASGGHSSSQCAGLSLSRPLLLGSTGSRRAGSVIVAHGPSCSAACGIFSDQGSNPCSLHWQADSQPLRHQGSPTMIFFKCTVPPDLSFAFLKPFSDFPVHSEYNPNSLTWPTEPCVILFSFPPPISSPSCSVPCSSFSGHIHILTSQVLAGVRDTASHLFARSLLSRHLPLDISHHFFSTVKCNVLDYTLFTRIVGF